MNKGLTFKFSYKDVGKNNLYNFKYDAREEGNLIARKLYYLEKLPKEIALASRSGMLKKNDIKETSKINSNKFFYRNSKYNINIIKCKKTLYKTNKRYINMSNSPLLFYRNNEKDIDTSKKPTLFYRRNKINIITLDNKLMIYNKNDRSIVVLDTVNKLEYNNFKYIFSKDILQCLILNNFKYLSNTEGIFELEKIRKRLFKINHLELTNIPRNIVVKDPVILNKILKDINIDNPAFLDKTSKNIFAFKDITSLELFKRWWWLNPAEPTDNLIVPMEDYKYSSKELLNKFNEYLRCNTHPISWGSNWGIDHTVPPSLVSIEIMIDVTNIITMLWHYNYVNWNNVTGKEAIQLLIEVLSSWYTLSTSKPNNDYYRVFRWVRWYAEGIYFKSKNDVRNNGTKYIGMLVADLIQYLKIHHFDVVPIQKNIIRMASIRINTKERNIIKELDTIKGKRFYLIEHKKKREVF